MGFIIPAVSDHEDLKWLLMQSISLLDRFNMNTEHIVHALEESDAPDAFAHISFFREAGMPYVNKLKTYMELMQEEL